MASEIRAAAALIRIEAARGGREDAAKLQATATDLDTIADNVLKGNVASRSDLDLAFARADLGRQMQNFGTSGAKNSTN